MYHSSKNFYNLAVYPFRFNYFGIANHKIPFYHVLRILHHTVGHTLFIVLLAPIYPTQFALRIDLSLGIHDHSYPYSHCIRPNVPISISSPTHPPPSISQFSCHSQSQKSAAREYSIFISFMQFSIYSYFQIYIQAMLFRANVKYFSFGVRSLVSQPALKYSPSDASGSKTPREKFFIVSESMKIEVYLSFKTDSNWLQAS